AEAGHAAGEDVRHLSDSCGSGAAAGGVHPSEPAVSRAVAGAVDLDRHDSPCLLHDLPDPLRRTGYTSGAGENGSARACREPQTGALIPEPSPIDIISIHVRPTLPAIPGYLPRGAPSSLPGGLLPVR